MFLYRNNKVTSHASTISSKKIPIDLFASSVQKMLSNGKVHWEYVYILLCSSRPSEVKF